MPVELRTAAGQPEVWTELAALEASGSRNKHRLDRRLQDSAFIRNHFPFKWSIRGQQNWPC